MRHTAPSIVEAFIRAYHEQRSELFAEAMQQPGEADLVSVFFEAEGHVVEALINRSAASCVQLMAAPMDEGDGPAVCYTITDFDDPLPAYQPMTWN